MFSTSVNFAFADSHYCLAAWPLSYFCFCLSSCTLYSIQKRLKYICRRQA